MREEMRPLTKKENRAWKLYLRGMKDGYNMAFGMKTGLLHYILKHSKQYKKGANKGMEVARNLEWYDFYALREAPAKKKRFHTDEYADYIYYNPADSNNSGVYKREWLYNRVYKEGSK